MRVLSQFKVSGLAAAALALGLMGCQRQSVQSYTVPKEDYGVKLASAPQGGGGDPHGGDPHGGMGMGGMPQADFKAPAGWKPRESKQQVGVGSFLVEGQDGRFADIRVVPLRGDAEVEKQSVDMWREDMGVAENDVKSSDVEVSGAKGHLYDLTSKEPKLDGKYKVRTLAAVVPKDDTLWFIKMAGDDGTVAAQEGNFKDFLKTISFKAPTPPAMTLTSNASDEPAGAQTWKMPAGWKQKPAGQMVLASYTTEKGADVSVSAFDGATGGLLANVNRWRGQMSLGPIDDAALPKETKTIDLADGSKATVVDVAGKNARSGQAGRLYGLIVPRGGKTWFYKMVGEPAAVGAEASNLAEFAASAK